MNLVFFCQSCGARFEVPSASAGKKGRCKHCGQLMTIPQAQELASMVALPAVATTSGDGAVAKGVDRDVKGAGSLSWLAAAPSDVGLAPLTVDSLSIGRAPRSTRPKYDDDLGDGEPYALGKPLVPTYKGSSGEPAAGDLKRLWRRELGIVQRSFRWLNETAYLLSVPFLMLILFGTIVRSRPLALLGATAVVLLNLGRIVAGLANVLVVPFRDGIFQGVAFLIPPFTFLYLSRHWDKLKKPTIRIVTPILTIALVFLAFAAIPSLRRDGKGVSAADLKAELREDVESLEGEMVDEVKKAGTLDVKSLGKEAESKVREAAGRLNSVGQPSGTGK